MNVKVRDIMSAHPISVRKNASFKEIAAWLREYRVSAFPVLDDGTVIGVVSEADMLAKEALDQVRHVQGVVAVRDRLVYPLPPVPSTPGAYF